MLYVCSNSSLDRQSGWPIENRHNKSHWPGLEVRNIRSSLRTQQGLPRERILHVADISSSTIPPYAATMFSTIPLKRMYYVSCSYISKIAGPPHTTLPLNKATLQRTCSISMILELHGKLRHQPSWLGTDKLARTTWVASV